MYFAREAGNVLYIDYVGMVDWMRAHILRNFIQMQLGGANYHPHIVYENMSIVQRSKNDNTTEIGFSPLSAVLSCLSTYFCLVNFLRQCYTKSRLDSPSHFVILYHISWNCWVSLWWGGAVKEQGAKICILWSRCILDCVWIGGRFVDGTGGIIRNRADMLVN